MPNAINYLVDTTYAPPGTTHVVVVHISSDTVYFDENGVTINPNVWEKHVGPHIYEWTGSGFHRAATQPSPMYNRLTEEYIRLPVSCLLSVPVSEKAKIEAAILLLVENGYFVCKHK
jgi:hypothetical protein